MRGHAGAHHARARRHEAAADIFAGHAGELSTGHGGSSADVLRSATAAVADEYALPAFLLDALTMMRQIHDELLADKLAQLLKALLHAVRSAAEGTLESLLPIDDFMRALEDYEALIAAKARSI